MKDHSNVIRFEQMKRIVLIVISAIVLAGCGKDEVVDQLVDNGGNNNENRVITFTANIPGENAMSLKFALTPNGANMSFSWEEGDEIQVCIANDAVREKQTVPLKNISADGKTATFDIVIPPAIQEGTFDIYGVYGGQGLRDSNPLEAVLPDRPYNNWNGFSDLRDRKQIMLKFVQRDVSVDVPSISVNFEHLGSLFNIKLKNVSTNTNWGCRFAYLTFIGINSGANAPLWGGGATPGSYYNLQTATCTETSYRPQFYCYTNYRLVPPNEVCEWWVWYAPNPNFVPSSTYKMRLNIQQGPEPPAGSTTGLTDIRDVSDNVPQRIHEAGKIYRLYSEWDGTAVKIVAPF